MSETDSEGYTLCPECQGYCVERIKNSIITPCHKCRGAGTLDWIEMVVGKKYVPKTTITNGVIPVFKANYFRKIRGEGSDKY